MYQKESISFLSSLNLNEIPNELIKEFRHNTHTCTQSCCVYDLDSKD